MMITKIAYRKQLNYICLKRRGQRIGRGKNWLKMYKGEDIIEDYRKRYGVDLLCAVVELRMLGADISEDYEYQLRQEKAENRGRFFRWFFR